MFDFEFDHFEDPADEDRLNDLVTAYESQPDTAYFDSDALEEIATHYFERGRFDSALEVIDRLIATQPYSSDAWTRRGILLNNLGRHEEALVAYEKALLLNPVDAETLVNRGITLDNLNRAGEALQAYEAAPADRPTQ